MGRTKWDLSLGTDYDSMEPEGVILCGFHRHFTLVMGQFCIAIGLLGPSMSED